MEFGGRSQILLAYPCRPLDPDVRFRHGKIRVVGLLEHIIWSDGIYHDGIAVALHNLDGK